MKLKFLQNIAVEQTLSILEHLYLDNWPFANHCPAACQAFQSSMAILQFTMIRMTNLSLEIHSDFHISLFHTSWFTSIANIQCQGRKYCAVGRLGWLMRRIKRVVIEHILRFCRIVKYRRSCLALGLDILWNNGSLIANKRSRLLVSNYWLSLMPAEMTTDAGRFYQFELPSYLWLPFLCLQLTGIKTRIQQGT